MFWNNHECFICYDKSGKSEQEKHIDLMSGKNGIILNYPIIPIKSVFDCKCECSLYAHNSCLSKLNSCPICRKNIKANVFYTPTANEKYGILAMYIYVAITILFIFILGHFCDRNLLIKADFCEHIDAKIPCIMYVVMFMFLYFIKWLENRWLYNTILRKKKN